MKRFWYARTRYQRLQVAILLEPINPQFSLHVHHVHVVFFEKVTPRSLSLSFAFPAMRFCRCLDVSSLWGSRPDGWWGLERCNVDLCVIAREPAKDGPASERWHQLNVEAIVLAERLDSPMRDVVGAETVKCFLGQTSVQSVSKLTHFLQTLVFCVSLPLVQDLVLSSRKSLGLPSRPPLLNHPSPLGRSQ